VNSISGYGYSRIDTMRRDLERRLQALEVAGSNEPEMWFERDDGMVCGHGKLMTYEEAEALYRVSRPVPIFLNKIDSRL
jgi:hypothetical protein